MPVAVGDSDNGPQRPSPISHVELPDASRA